MKIFHRLEPATRGWFAIVCYIDGPLKSALDRLRQLVPGKGLPPLHITVLPPRPLTLPPEQACCLIKSVAEDIAAFAVEFSEVRHFTETDFLYLDIAEGNRELRRIHQIFNAGELRHAEEFEYRPHLTLGGPVPALEIAPLNQHLQRAWRAAAVNPRIMIDEIVCLWLPPSSPAREWQRYSSCRLAAGEVRKASTNQRY